MNFNMENLVKKPLIDGRTFFVDDLSEEVDQSFMDMYSNNPSERSLTAPESNIFGINDRASEYARFHPMSQMFQTQQQQFSCIRQLGFEKSTER